MQEGSNGAGKDRKSWNPATNSRYAVSARPFRGLVVPLQGHLSPALERLPHRDPPRRAGGWRGHGRGGRALDARSPPSRPIWPPPMPRTSSSRFLIAPDFTSPHGAAGTKELGASAPGDQSGDRPNLAGRPARAERKAALEQRSTTTMSRLVGSENGEYFTQDRVTVAAGRMAESEERHRDGGDGRGGEAVGLASR